MSAEFARTVPLFPLPNVVLFPRAVLPLHIFEERYKIMTADALDGEKLIAMALLKPGWEKAYYSKPAIEEVVCVGKILAHEKLADGTYNFLLQGAERARVLSEIKGHPYRLAQVEPLAETPVLEIDLMNQRGRLIELFSESVWSQLPVARQFRDLLAGPLATAQVADLVAFNFLEDIALKQSLLADGDIVGRVDRVIHAIQALQPVIAGPSRKDDPSMN